MDRLDGRMDRLDGRMDRLIETKADQSALDATNEKLDALSGDVKDIGRRMDRLEAGIGTLKWIIGAEVAVIGVVLAFIKAC